MPHWKDRGLSSTSILSLIDARCSTPVQLLRSPKDAHAESIPYSRQDFPHPKSMLSRMQAFVRSHLLHFKLPPAPASLPRPRPQALRAPWRTPRLRCPGLVRLPPWVGRSSAPVNRPQLLLKYSLVVVMDRNPIPGRNNSHSIVLFVFFLQGGLGLHPYS